MLRVSQLWRAVLTVMLLHSLCFLLHSAEHLDVFELIIILLGSGQIDSLRSLISSDERTCASRASIGDGSSLIECPSYV